MDQVDTNILNKLARLAEEMPQAQAARLLALVAEWRGEARRSPRESYIESVRVMTGDGVYHGHARNISGTGIFIETAAELALGDHISLELIFISAANPLKLAGDVVRVGDEGVGVVFDTRTAGQISKLDEIIGKHALIMHPPKA